MKNTLIFIIGLMTLMGCRRQLPPPPSILDAYKQYQVLVQLKKELRTKSRTRSELDQLVSFGETLAPKDGELKLIMASALKAQGDFERSKLLLEEGITLVPSYSPLFTAYGELLVESGFLKEGRDYCLRAMELNPIDTSARRCVKLAAR